MQHQHQKTQRAGSGEGTDPPGVQERNVKPKMHHLHTAEVPENVKSIRAIPEKLLPNGPARKTLVGMAQDGYDVYAYTPLQIGVKDAEKRWNVWFNGVRYPLEEWLAEFNRGAQDPSK